MRLGYHYHIPAIKIDGKIHTTAQQGIFIDALAAHCDEIICFLHSPIQNELNLIDYSIENKKVKLVNIGIHTKVYWRILFQLFFVKKYKKYKDHLDALIIREPTPLFPIYSRAKKNIPLILLIVGDAVEEAIELQQNWFRKKIIQAFLRYNYQQLEKIVSHSLILANNKQTEEKWKSKAMSIKSISTGIIKTETLFFREDTCNSLPINLLYVGRISFLKGIMDIVNAFIILNNKGIDICLHIVGQTENNDFLEEVKNLLLKNNLSHKLNYHGYVRFGTELNKIYKNSDIFITASIGTEGFPRTIYEAFSQSLPVVATKVGGVPRLLDDRVHAILCEPKKPEILADSIEEIIKNKLLRRKIIKNSYNFIKKHTLENSSRQIMDHIKRWTNNKELK